MKSIVFGGGCFWGVQSYFKRVIGVQKTMVGYTGGKNKFPTYEQICTGETNHAEVCKVNYDDNETSLKILLEHFFFIIDPTLENQQGDDVGSQYRTGIYYTEENDKRLIKEYIDSIRNNYSYDIKTEVKPLEEFWDAEDFHQDYVL